MVRRISLTMFAMVVGALVFAGLATLGLTALDSVSKTQSQLVFEAKQLAEGVQEQVLASNHHETKAVLRYLLAEMKAPLELQGEAVYGVNPEYRFYNLLQPSKPVHLPGGISLKPAEKADLIYGSPVTGHRGNLAWAAFLFSTQQPVGAVPGCPQCQAVNLVVFLSRRAPVGVGSAGTWFAIVAAGTVVISLIVANRLGRRIARPLQQAEGVTGRIAAGDLSARVPVPKGEGELVSLAASVNDMANSLARARGVERQFLMSVSHDLRTPLTSIRGYAEALTDGATDDVPRAAGVILSEARRLERLVGDLLDLAKLETGAFRLSCGSIDLSEVVAATVEGFEPEASSLSLSLVLSSDAGARVVCYADPDRLGQVVANLVENALKYARRQVTVTACYDAERRPALLVEDDGPGIAPADLDKVFQRLYQSVSAASRKLGSGLGLAIVNELVAAMGGEVRAASPLGPSGGTRMVVTLRNPTRSPAAPSPAPAGAAPGRP